VTHASRSTSPTDRYRASLRNMRPQMRGRIGEVAAISAKSRRIRAYSTKTREPGLALLIYRRSGPGTRVSAITVWFRSSSPPSPLDAWSSCALTASDQVPPASLPSFLVDRKTRTEPPGNLSERARSFNRLALAADNRLVGSSSPPSPTTQSYANRDFPARPRIAPHWRDSWRSFPPPQRVFRCRR
jgi:hypothetical protein